MTWKGGSTMDQKIAFIREWESGQYYFKSLCEAYGISRQTGYNLIKRYQSEGLNALISRSRRPLGHPSTSSEELVELVQAWRNRKGWGAKKIRVKMIEKLGESAVPSVTTIHNILIREGLVEAKKYRRRVGPSYPVFDPQSSNEIWSGDYKGSFLLGNKRRCYPLTICDSYSRFIFRIEGQYHERTAHVQRVLTKLFREWGIPESFHTDNGSPFASIQSPCGYGRLSYWLIDHGIKPVFSDPGRPDQNGRHERMHKDLKSRCCKPPACNLQVQNRRMNAFVREYNEERPHEGLGMATPSQVHERSRREWRDKVSPPEYDTDLLVKRVSKNGSIRWGSYESVYISSCLYNQYVGVKKLGNRVWEVYYRDFSLGYFLEGEQIEPGKYMVLNSDRDLKGRPRAWK